MSAYCSVISTEAMLVVVVSSEKAQSKSMNVAGKPCLNTARHKNNVYLFYAFIVM
jgi:hypothetical protein